MNDMTKEFNKGDLLYIDKDEKAQWGQPEGYPWIEESIIEWDGNTEGLDAVDGYYRVSDAIFSDEEIKVGIIKNSDGIEMSISNYWDTLVNAGVATDDIVYADFVVFVRKDNVSIQGLEFKKAGVYFMCGSGGGTYVQRFETRTIRPIATEFLPEGYPWKEQDVTIEWDGITDGRASFEVEGATYYKVSDLTPDLDGAKYKATEPSVDSEGTLKVRGASDGGFFYTDTRSGDLIWAIVVNLKETGDIENGTYFLYLAMNEGITYTSAVDKSGIHPISSDFLPLATPTTAGAMKQAAAVANVTAAPTAEEFNALLKSLRDAGILRQNK